MVSHKNYGFVNIFPKMKAIVEACTYVKECLSEHHWLAQHVANSLRKVL